LLVFSGGKTWNIGSKESGKKENIKHKKLSLFYHYKMYFLRIDILEIHKYLNRYIYYCRKKNMNILQPGGPI